MSNSLQPHGLKHSRLLCPSLSPKVCSNSCPLSWWCDLFLLLLPPPSPFAFNLSQHQGLFQWVGSLHKVAKVLVFSISSSSEYSGLISFWIDWLDLLTVQGTLYSLLQHPQLKSINSSLLSLLYGPTFTPLYDYWKHHNSDYTDLCQQSDISAF